MKNYPYNTGRTVTISLDTLGNAAIWQIFQILTDGTNNISQGDEPDASPAADSDAATEIFLHLAETADDRADGADPVQKLFLQGIKEEYMDVFEDGDGPANVTANEEPETITRTALSGHEYTAANIDLAEAVAERNACPVSLTADDDARELRATGTAAAIEDFFAYCKEAAEEAANVDPEEAYLAETIAAWRARPENAELDALLEANAIDTSASPENLYRAGVFEGLAAALHTQIAWATDDYNEIQAAIYKAYGVAW